MTDFLDRHQLLASASQMDDPMVIADVSEGSGKARFLLVDTWEPPSPATAPEINRQLFNALRKNGELDAGPDGALKLGKHRAWRVRAQDHGEGEAVQPGGVP